MTHLEIVNKAAQMIKSKYKAESIRGALAMGYLANENDPGRWGRAEELVSALPASRKTRISKQGWDDVRIKVRSSSGHIRYARAEVKTNGGRIEELLDDTLQQVPVHYVIYSMNDVPVPQGKKAKAEGKPVEYRNVPAVVIPRDLFLAKLQEFNAIKPMTHGGMQDGWGIQVTSKRWYEWLMEYPVVFQQGYTYEAWEFEGLE